jgi:hypothetical protein
MESEMAAEIQDGDWLQFVAETGLRIKWNNNIKCSHCNMIITMMTSETEASCLDSLRIINLELPSAIFLSTPLASF